jgi:hypothetical protein
VPCFASAAALHACGSLPVVGKVLPTYGLQIGYEAAAGV